MSGVTEARRWNSGILGKNTLMVGEQFGGQLVVEYRPPQMTGIWLEQSDEPVRLPMPGLLLLRHMKPNQRPTYLMYAVLKRPMKTGVKLFNVPLPNTYDDGRICWGSVAAPGKDKLHPVDLEADWNVLLGSKFGDHSVHSKSVKYHGDIRKMLIEIDREKPARYPYKDLLPCKMKLSEILNTFGKSQ